MFIYSLSVVLGVRISAIPAYRTCCLLWWQIEVTLICHKMQLEGTNISHWFIPTWVLWLFRHLIYTYRYIIQVRHYITVNAKKTSNCLTRSCENLVGLIEIFAMPYLKNDEILFCCFKGCILFQLSDTTWAVFFAPLNPPEPTSSFMCHSLVEKYVCIITEIIVIPFYKRCLSIILKCGQIWESLI